MSSIDFVLVPNHVVSVRGTVLNAMTGRPAKGSSVALQPSDPVSAVLGLNPFNAVADANGSFEIDNVIPDSYVVVANLEDQSRQYFARQNVYVGTTAVDNLSLVVSPGVSVPGRVIYVGQADARPLETSVWLRSGDDSFSPGRSAPLNADETFVAKNVPPGIYQVDVRPTCSTCYLKSTKIAGVDVLQDGLDLTAGAPRGSLDIVVSAAGGFVSGTVADNDDQPMAGAMVVLVPDPGQRKQIRLYKESTTDQYGGFKLQGIAPGDYKVFAWEGGQDVAYRDPEFLKAIDNLGAEVSVQESAGTAVRLKIISATNSQ
jgi:hypothetical protein